MRPRSTSGSFRTGVGWVGPEVGTLWGSNQAALSLAMWSATRRVRELPPAYNYPLHLHAELDAPSVEQHFPNLVHVHYHWLLNAEALAANPLFLSSGPLLEGQREWLRRATPLDTP